MSWSSDVINSDDLENTVSSKYYDIEKLQNLKRTNKSKSLSLFHKNVCYLRKNFDNLQHLPSRQILFPRTSWGLSPPTSSGRSLKMQFDHPGDIPIWCPKDFSKWRPGDVLIEHPGDIPIWRPRDLPGK